MSETRGSTPPVTGAPEVAIGRLALSVPGADRGAGERVAHGVTRRLAERLPPGAMGRLGRVELTVRPRDSSDEAVIEAVVEGVLRSLPRGFR